MSLEITKLVGKRDAQGEEEVRGLPSGSKEYNYALARLREERLDAVYVRLRPIADLREIRRLEIDGTINVQLDQILSSGKIRLPWPGTARAGTNTGKPRQTYPDGWDFWPGRVVAAPLMKGGIWFLCSPYGQMLEEVDPEEGRAIVASQGTWEQEQAAVMALLSILVAESPTMAVEKSFVADFQALQRQLGEVLSELANTKQQLTDLQSLIPAGGGGKTRR